MTSDTNKSNEKLIQNTLSNDKCFELDEDFEFLDTFTFDDVFENEDKIINTDDDVIGKMDYVRKTFKYDKHILNVSLSVYTDNLIPSNRIIIETNMFNLTDFLFVLSNNNLAFSLSDGYINIKNKKIDNISINLPLKFNEEIFTFSVSGFYNFIEYFYDSLIDELKHEYLYIEKMEVFSQIMNKIYSCDANVCNIKLFKILPFSLALKLNQLKINRILDIKSLDINNLYLIDLLTIYNSILNNLIENPEYIFSTITMGLKKKQISIIQKRSYTTLEELGKQYNCTRERIRQIEKSVINKLIRYNNKFNFDESLKMYLENHLYYSSEMLNTFNISLYLIEKICFKTSFYKSNILKDVYFSGAEEREIVDFFLENMPDTLDVSNKNEYLKDIISALCDIDRKYYFCVSEIEELINNCYKYKYGYIYSKCKLSKTYLFPKIVKKYFTNGIDIYDEDSLYQFKSFCFEKFNCDIYDATDRSISSILQKCLILKEKGLYFYDDNLCLINNSLKSSIVSYIKSTNSTVISYNEILDKFNIELLNVGVDNRYFLAAQLKLSNIDGVTFSRDYILKGNKSTISDLYEEIEKFINKSTKLVTKEDIENKFPNIKYTSFQNLLNNTNIINMNGYFTTYKKLNISDIEYVEIANVLDSIIDTSKIYHAREIFNKSRLKLEYFINRNGIDHYLKFYYIINKMYPNKYKFNRPYISHHELSIKDGNLQLVDKIILKGSCSIFEDIRFFAQEIGYYLDSYLDFIDGNNSHLIFKDNFNVISIEKANINAEDFDNFDDILDQFLDGDCYRQLNQFYLNWKLPKLNIQWNEWVLYSIINLFSNKYHAIMSNKNLHEATPIIVSNDFDDENIDLSKIKKIKTVDSSIEFDF